jgi:site-specific DNA recombinase
MNNEIKPFVYPRRSQDERNRQILSLPAQIRELRALGEREGIKIYQVLEESRSAKEPGRPVFNKMLDRIEHGEANAIFVWDIDRLYRNPVDEGRVRWMLQRGIIKEIRTPTRRFLPQDAGLLMGVEGGRATDYIIRLAANVKRGIREKLMRGEYASGPKPLGYIYDKRRRNIVPDPKRASVVLRTFERYATGEYSLKQISALLFDQGIKSRTGKPWSNWSVAHVLNNRVYEGVMEWKDELFEGKYKLIMPRELFAKVQKVFKDKTRPRKLKTAHDFPFRGLFRCSCGSMITAQFGRGHGGIYRYYRCTRKMSDCHESYVQEKIVMTQIVELLKPLAISNRAADGILGMIQKEANEEGKIIIGTMEQLDEKLEVASN